MQANFSGNIGEAESSFPWVDIGELHGERWEGRESMWPEGCELKRGGWGWGVMSSGIRENANIAGKSDSLSLDDYCAHVRQQIATKIWWEWGWQSRFVRCT